MIKYVNSIYSTQWLESPPRYTSREREWKLIQEYRVYSMKHLRHHNHLFVYSDHDGFSSDVPRNWEIAS